MIKVITKSLNHRKIVMFSDDILFILFAISNKKLFNNFFYL